MMTYKEYVEYGKSKLNKWDRFLMYLSFNFLEWRKDYLEYAIRRIADAKNLEEAHKMAVIALPERG